MQASFVAALRNAKRPLVLAVGGGNDSVSTLFLQSQLMQDYGYNPDQVAVVAVLPDCLDYQNLTPTSHPLIGIITSGTTRSVQGKAITSFPEQMLAKHKEHVPNLRVETIFGVSMRDGSTGVARALQHLVDSTSYDLVLAIDVGGDFIAVEDNIDVLSPMMDGYMLHALRHLENHVAGKVPIVYSVFGLGTDGESTPEMLGAALARLPDVAEGEFDNACLNDVFSFYRQHIEPNRYSRTADFTIREIDGTGHDNPAVFHGRFHTQTSVGAPVNVHYGKYMHYQDPRYFGKYYLFSEISRVRNPFAFACSSGISWYLRVQNNRTRINHELNGQAYDDIGVVLKQDSLHGVSLFFGTPSRKFNAQAQYAIYEEVVQAVTNGVYNMAFVYADTDTQVQGLHTIIVADGLALIGKDEKTMAKFLRMHALIKPA